MNSSNSLVCWKCGAALEGVPMPLSRLSECLVCHAELHVCRLCRFFDPHKPESCAEERADPPKDKQRANFCEYFQPQAGAFQRPDDSTANRAKAELDKLFGK
ncbi:MAG: hypothetical protein KGL98_01230 [Gammaproteobacteria bacterium]|nr:hypothetical protein [Gammaproteobacteria bacterium]